VLDQVCYAYQILGSLQFLSSREILQERTAGNPCPSRVPVQSEKLASQRTAIGTWKEIRNANSLQLWQSMLGVILLLEHCEAREYIDLKAAEGSL